MATPDVIVEVKFLEYGAKAPTNSSYKGKISTKSLFGKKGYFNYTSREDAIEKSVDNSSMSNADDEKSLVTLTQDTGGSYADYTSRGNATANSVKDGEYFTMTNNGKLFTGEDRETWAKANECYFSKKGDVAWQLFVSLPDYKALEHFNITDQNDFARITETALKKCLKNLGFKYENMVWWEDYHTNTDHPHLHITFLEKVTTRKEGRSALNADELKMIKTAFVTEISARVRYQEQYGENATDVLKMITPLRQEVVADVSNVVKDINDKDATLEKIPYNTYKKIYDLYSKLPKQGRLQYNSYAMKEYRNDLDDIVNDLLKVDDIKKDYDAFMDKVRSLTNNVDSSINASISSLLQSQDKKVRVQIANAVLKEFKNWQGSSIEFLANKENRWKGAVGEKILDSADKDKEFVKGDTTKIKKKTVDDVDHKTKKKYTNFMKKSYGFNKKSYSALKEKSTALLSVSKSAINEQERELEKEINEYLYAHEEYHKSVDDEFNNPQSY